MKLSKSEAEEEPGEKPDSDHPKLSVLDEEPARKPSS